MVQPEINSCTICHITIDTSLRIYKTAKNVFLCQSCRKLYYNIWREILEDIFCHIYRHEKIKIERFIQQGSHVSSSHPAVRNFECFKGLLSSMNIQQLSQQILKFLSTPDMQEKCINKHPFANFKSVESCQIKSSEKAISMKSFFLKKKYGPRVDPRDNKKCTLCRFKLILITLKEVPKLKLKISTANQDPSFHMFINTLGQSKNKDILVPSALLVNLYEDQDDLFEFFVRLNSDVSVRERTNGKASALTVCVKKQLDDAEEEFGQVRKFRKISSSQISGDSGLPEGGQISERSLVEVKKNDMPQPQGYISPFDIQITLGNIFNLFCEGIVVEFCWRKVLR